MKDQKRQDKRIQLVASAEFVRKVDEWRRLQPDLPNRSAAIRQMVEAYLAGEERQQQRRRR